jgi:hypothetical protein
MSLQGDGPKFNTELHGGFLFYHEGLKGFHEESTRAFAQNLRYLRDLRELKPRQQINPRDLPPHTINEVGKNTTKTAFHLGI